MADGAGPGRRRAGAGQRPHTGLDLVRSGPGGACRRWVERRGDAGASTDDSQRNGPGRSCDMTTEDVVAIQQLLALYGHAADAPTQNLLDDVFTADAVFESRGRGRRLDGLDAIKAWFAEGKPPHPPAH